MRLAELFGRNKKDDEILERMNGQIRLLTKEGFLNGAKEVSPKDFNRAVAASYFSAEKRYFFQRGTIKTSSSARADALLKPMKKEFAQALKRLLKFIGP